VHKLKVRPSSYSSSERRLPRLVASTVCLVAAVTPGLTQAPEQPERTVTIAVVRDGPGPEMQAVDAIERELQLHLPEGVRTRFDRDAAFDAGWDPARARPVLERALGDAEIDYVLAVGSLVTYEAARPDLSLAKPVISGFVQRADIFGLPYSEDDASLKENFGFIAVPHRATEDVTSFERMIGFGTLHALVDAADLKAIRDLREGMERVERELGFRVVLAPATTEAGGALAGLGPDVEAVYVMRLQRFSDAQRRQLFDGLAERSIPSFSLVGHADVRAGALAGLTPDLGQQVERRVALNLASLIRGGSVAELPVILTSETQLLINGRTARSIGYFPDQETRIFAELVDAEALEEIVEPLELARALRMAEQGNTALTIRDAQVESVRQDQQVARAALLPQLTSDVTYRDTNGGDLFPDESTTRGRLALRQQIYDDTAWGAYRSSKHSYEGTEWEREADRLDLLADAGQLYYQLALARALLRIEIDNLNLNRDFLELAQLRRDVGYSGREEVLRWESAIADSRSAVYRASQDVETAQISLNQVLGVDQGQRWNPEQTHVDPDRFGWLDGQLDEVFDDFAALDRLRDFLLQFALEQAPEVRAVESAVAGQQVRLDTFKRRWWLPTFVLDFSYIESFDDIDSNLIFDQDRFYTVSVGAVYPIFQGGRKSADIRRARADQAGLERELQLARELVERRTRDSLQRAERSFPRIRFTRQAADAAAEALDLVQDQYALGFANVTDLRQAQNQSFLAEQVATIAVFDFLSDLIELQRAISWFTEDHDPSERDQLAQRALAAVEQQ
jgi:outer membrane protein TolC